MKTVSRYVWTWGRLWSVQHDSYTCHLYTGTKGFPTRYVGQAVERAARQLHVPPLHGHQRLPNQVRGAFLKCKIHRIPLLLQLTYIFKNVTQTCLCTNLRRDF